MISFIRLSFFNILHVTHYGILFWWILECFIASYKRVDSFIAYNTFFFQVDYSGMYLYFLLIKLLLVRYITTILWYYGFFITFKKRLYSKIWILVKEANSTLNLWAFCVKNYLIPRLGTSESVFNLVFVFNTYIMRELLHWLFLRSK